MMQCKSDIQTRGCSASDFVYSEELGIEDCVLFLAEVHVDECHH